MVEPLWKYLQGTSLAYQNGRGFNFTFYASIGTIWLIRQKEILEDVLKFHIVLEVPSVTEF